MKKSILFLAVLIISYTLSAQKGAVAFLKTGYSYAPGASRIFNQIASVGTPAFNDNNYLIIGVELYYRSDKYIISWEGYSQGQPAYSLGSRSAIPSLAASHFKLGRIVKQYTQSWIYPSIGFGASVIDLADYNLVRESVINEKQGTNSIHRMLITPSFDLSINQDFFVRKVHWNEKLYTGLILGLRAGYRTSLNSIAWTDANWNKLTNLPSFTNKSFYLSLNIGTAGLELK